MKWLKNIYFLSFSQFVLYFHSNNYLEISPRVVILNKRVLMAAKGNKENVVSAQNFSEQC